MPKYYPQLPLYNFPCRQFTVAVLPFQISIVCQQKPQGGIFPNRTQFPSEQQTYLAQKSTSALRPVGQMK